MEEILLGRNFIGMSEKPDKAARRMERRTKLNSYRLIELYSNKLLLVITSCLRLLTEI